MSVHFVTGILESCRDGGMSETLNTWFTTDERAAIATAAISNP